MSELQTPPAPATQESAPALLDPGDYAQYLLRTKNEIQFVLRSLIEQVAQITIFFNEGHDLLLTTLLAVDDQGITLDYGASQETNRKAQEANRLFAITSLDKVKVQFLLRGLKEIEFEGRPAFRAALPDAVLRLQRREYYRLTMPITRPLRCRIPLPGKENSDGTPAAIEVDVVDISGGGMAIIAPPEGLNLEADMEFPDCTIELPEIGAINTTLRIRSLFDVTLRSGAHLRRSGCQYVNLRAPMATLIQRYIIKVERERKARESGLA